MDDPENPRQIYAVDNDVEATSTPPQALVPEDAPPPLSVSVFRAGTSPWMRSAATQQSHNSNTPTTPPSPPPQAGQPSDTNGVQSNEKSAMLSNVITQEEKEKRHVKREQQREEEEAMERRIRQKENDDLVLCRLYFTVGCFGLPFLLFVNVFYFSSSLKASAGNFRVRKYVWLSLIVALIESFLWILWFVVFQLLRDSTLGALDITRSDLAVGFLV